MDLLGDRYEVLALLGSGGLGDVHRVRDRAVPGRVLALKRRRPGAPSGELLAEFVALSRVQHPNLPAIHDFHDDLGEGREGYTLEEVSGETADRAADRDPAIVPDIAAGVCRALAHIHARGLVHGDVHPRNILVGPGGVVKLLDLSPSSAGVGGRSALETTAPERLTGGGATVATDLYSLGVTLHRLMTGVMPYPDFPQLPPGGRPEGESRLGAYAEVVLSLLAARPEERPTRASIVLARLAEATGRVLPLLTAADVRAELRDDAAVEVQGWPGALTAAVLDSLAASRAGVMHVGGALGCGRSHALRRLKWSLQARGDLRVLAVCGSAGEPPAGLLRRLLSAVPSAERARLPEDLHGAVNAVVADLDADLTGGDDPAKARALSTDRLARALVGLGRARPTAVLCDDADDADDLSLDVLRGAARYVAHRPEEAGALVLVLAGGPDGPAAAVTGEAGREARRLSPPAFDEQATSDLCRSAFLGRTPTHRLVQALASVGGGNPLVLAEAIGSAFERGWIVAGEEDVDLGPGAPSPLPVPAAAAEAVVGRLARVPVECAAIVGLMAATSVAVPASLLGPALGVPETEAARRIEALRRLDVVRWEIADGEARLVFAAPALRTAAAVRGGPDRATWARLADIEEEGLSLAGKAICAEAALASGDDGGLRALSVGRELVRRGRGAEALRLLAAPLLRGAPGLGAALGEAHALVGDDSAAIAAWSTLPESEAQRRIGGLLVRRGRYPEALEKLDAVVDSQRQKDPAAAAETLGWMARARMMQGEYDKALAHCAEAKAAAGGALLVRVQYVEGLVGFYRGDFAAAGAAFDAALHTAEGAGMLVEQADALNAIGLIHYRRGELDRAHERFRETLALADRSGDRDRTLVTLMNVAVIHQERGEYELAESRYREALSMARVLGNRSGVMKVTQNLGNLDRFLGSLDTAEEYLTQSLELAEADGNRYIGSHDRCLLGEVAWLRDDLVRAQSLLSQALDGFTSVGSVGEAADCRRSLSQVALGRGDLDEAAALAEEARAHAQASGLTRIEVLAELVLAEVARRRGGDLGDALARAEGARAKLDDMKRPDVAWEVLLTLHRLHRDRGEADVALALGRDCLRELDQLASGLPDARRAVFLAVKNRREAVAELRWLDRLGPPEGGEPSTRLSRLLDVNQRLNAELDLEKLLEYIIDSAILLTTAERGFLLMVSERAKSAEPAEALEIVVARNIDRENIKNKKFKVSYSIAQQVIETGEAVLTTDAMGDDRYSQFLSIHSMKLRSVLCLPLVRQGKVHGALYIDNRFQKGAFTQGDLAFMEAFAHQAAIALTNARLLEERGRALAELALSRAEVEALNAKLRSQIEEKDRALQDTEQKLVVQQRQLTRAHGYESIIGESPRLRAMFHVLSRVAESDVPVLVTGESGTGKELVARAVHYNGPRKDRTFIAINCSSIPETLIESEMFGHVRGSFTGATSDKKGVFEVADKGTLFLDEIGEMPLEMQAKLLRALQEGEIQKVGSPRALKVDVRIIAATNRSLREMIAQKSFREDLFYRLAVVTIELPPLRDRPEDIPLLVQHFLQKNRAEGLGLVRAVSPEAMRLLMRYSWPGNVRELETAVKNASIFCETDVLMAKDFSNFPNIMGAGEAPVVPSATGRAVRPLADLEREAIIQALEVYGGNKKRAAEQLGIDRRTLYNKLEAYGISIERRAHVLGRDD